MLDVHTYAKYNDNSRYILSVIDIISKYLYLIPLKKKSGSSAVSAFRFIFEDSEYSTRRPVWVRFHKGKEFLNKYCQDMIRDEG